MPLSDNEQRLLEQMEQALSAEDPKFASTMTGISRGGMYARMALVVVAIAVGIALLLVGVSSGNVLIGVIGFLIMLGGTAFAFSRPHKSGPEGVVLNDGQVRHHSAKRRAPLMQRFEERWDRRRGQ